MKRRAMGVTFFIAIAAITIYFLYPRNGLKIGPSPVAFNFVPKEAIRRKPWFTLPIMGGIAIPSSEDRIYLSRSMHRGLAGFLEFEAPHCYPIWEVGGCQFHANTYFLEVPTGAPISAITRLKQALPVPYALEPQYRKAQLRMGAGESPIAVELPVAPSHPQPPLQSTKARAGPWTIRAEPKAWKATSAPLEFRITVQGPARKVEMLIDYDYVQQNMMGYNPLLQCGVWVTPNRPFPLTVNPRRTDHLRGTLYEVEAIPLTFSADRHLNLSLKGKTIYAGWRGRSHTPKEFGFKAFRIGDSWFGNAVHNYPPFADERILEAYRAEPVVNGHGLVAGFGYRVKASYPFDLKLERPVTSEMLGYGTQPR